MKYIHSLCVVVLMSLSLQADATNSLKTFYHEHPELAHFVAGAAVVGAFVGSVKGSWYLYKKAEWWWVMRKPAQVLYNDALKLYTELNQDFEHEINLLWASRGVNPVASMQAGRDLEDAIVQRYAALNYPFYTFVYRLDAEIEALDFQKKILEAQLARGSADDIKLEMEELVGNVGCLSRSLVVLRDTIKATYRYKFEEKAIQPSTVVVVPSFHI